MDKVHILKDLGNNNLESFIKQHVSKCILLILSRCKVFYDGRARSTLDEGDRVIIIKPDGSLLIHKNKKREPINWQPSGSIISWKVKNNSFILKSIRKKPREELIVTILKVYHACAFKCDDHETIKLKGSESEMVEIIFNNPNIIENGFIPLSREYQIPTGIIDILGKDSKGNWVILEIKRRKADLQAVSQLKRYVDYFKEKYGKDRVRGIIVAPSITISAKNLIKNENLEYKRMIPPKECKNKPNKNSTKKLTILDEWL